MTANLIQSDSRNIYEGYLKSYESTNDESLISIMYRFTGDFWKNTNRPSIESAGLDPFLLKEAYLKTLDRRGIERPNANRFVEETEAITDQPFWESGANPVTMTRIHEMPVEDAMVYDYEY